MSHVEDVFLYFLVLGLQELVLVFLGDYSDSKFLCGVCGNSHIFLYLGSRRHGEKKR